MNSDHLGTRQLLIAALLFSTGAVAIKAIGLTGLQVACARSLVAAMIILAFLPGARKWSWRIVPTALAYALTLAAFGCGIRGHVNKSSGVM